MRRTLTLALLTTLTFAVFAGCEVETEPPDEVEETDPNTVLEPQPAVVQVTQAEPYGEYLTDAQGRALYLFMADSARTQSTCYDACAEAWPPLLTEGEPQAGPNVNAAGLGTLQRRTGEMQVTYNGWPLYYYVQDTGAGQATGQDVEGFGAEWYLVSPQGEPVHAEHGNS